MTVDALNKLPTHRLLAYKKKLMKLSPSEDSEYESEQDYEDEEYFSDDSGWSKAHLDLISVLNTREHVERKPEASPLVPFSRSSRSRRTRNRGMAR